MKDYSETQNYWDNVFDPQKVYTPSHSIGIKEIDDSISWLAHTHGKILDFGCGNGRLLFAALLS